MPMYCLDTISQLANKILANFQQQNAAKYFRTRDLRLRAEAVKITLQKTHEGLK